MKRRPRGELTRRIDQLEKKAGVRKCMTCRDWPDVIELHRGTVGEVGPDALPEAWGSWREHGGICPGCGRAPRVYQVVLAAGRPPEGASLAF